MRMLFLALGSGPKKLYEFVQDIDCSYENFSPEMSLSYRPVIALQIIPGGRHALAAYILGVHKLLLRRRDINLRMYQK